MKGVAAHRDSVVMTSRFVRAEEPQVCVVCATTAVLWRAGGDHGRALVDRQKAGGGDGGLDHSALGRSCAEGAGSATMAFPAAALAPVLGAASQSPRRRCATASAHSHLWCEPSDP